METVVTIIVWAALLLLALRLAGRVRGTTRRTSGPGSTPPSPGQATDTPPATPSPQAPGEHARRRQDDALVDGLVIGGFLAHRYHRDRIDELTDRVDELSDERDAWFSAAMGGDDPGAELDLDPFGEIDDVGADPWTDPYDHEVGGSVAAGWSGEHDEHDGHDEHDEHDGYDDLDGFW